MRFRPGKLKIAFGLTAIGALLWIISCSTMGRLFIEKPTVKLDRVRVQDVTGAGATVLFGFEVDNPNAFELKVDSLRYEAEIAGHPISAGKIENITSVPAKSKAVVEVPIPVRYSDLFASILDFMHTQSSSYHVKGEAKFGVMTIPFDEKGEFKLNQ